MNNESTTWSNEEYDNALNELRTILQDHEGKKKDKIQKLAKKLDELGYEKQDICTKLCDDLRGYNCSKRYIRMCLPKEYKHEYELEEQEEEKNKRVSPQIQEKGNISDLKKEEEKPIEVFTTTSGQTITEPSNENEDKKLSPTPEQPQEPNVYDGIKQKYEQEISKVKAEADKYMELLNIEKKQKRDLDNEVVKLSNQIKEERARIFQLEQKEESKPKIQNEIILSRMILGLLQTRAIPERLKAYPQTTKFKLLLQGFNEKGNEVFNLEPII